MRIAEFIGNRPLVDLLSRARLPQTTLFSGPEGVGKKSLATALAARDNCLHPAENDACGGCPACIKIASGHHPDVLVIDATWIQRFVEGQKKTYNPQVTPIAVARELVKEAQYRPYEGKLRYFILDAAEKLNEPAANALLKTLEEPPETTRFILVTAFPDRLLETVRSRCQQFLFQALSRSEVQAYLRQRGEEEADIKAAFASGSIGRALHLDLERERADRTLLIKMLAHWVQKQSYASLYTTLETPEWRKDFKNRQRVLELLDALRSLVEDLYYLHLDQPERVVNLDHMDTLRDTAGACTLDWLRRFLYTIDEARQDVQQYVSPLMTFEAIWLKSLDYVGSRPGQV